MAVARRPRRTWPQRLLVFVGIVVALSFGLVVYLLNLVQDKASQVQRIAIAGDVLAPEVSTAEPRNLLVVGIDSASGLDPDDPRAVDRGQTMLTDTMMIVRLDPVTETAAILSIPRDLAVDIGSSRQKINAAMSMGGGPDGGGVSLLIETIESTFGIPINNYVQVDFATFLGVVEAVGGVPYYLEHPVRDTTTGLLISRAGCQTIGADDALAFVRSRSGFQEQVDGQWQAVGLSSDFERIQRQQSFVVAMVERAIAKGARNPVTLNDLINEVTDDVTLDTRMTFAEMLELGDQFRDFRTQNLRTLTFDGVSDISLGASAALAVNLETDHNQELLALFRGTTAGADDAGAGDPDASASGEPGFTPGVPTDDTFADAAVTPIPEVAATPTPTPTPEPTPTPSATPTPEPTPTPTPPPCS